MSIIHPSTAINSTVIPQHLQQTCLVSEWQIDTQQAFGLVYLQQQRQWEYLHKLQAT